MNTIKEDFTKILMFMGIPQEKINDEASFIEDYDFDESQFICLALYMGIFFKVNLRSSEYDEIGTVGEAINLVRRKLEID